MSGSLWPHGLSPWNSPGQNTGVGSLSLLQTIFPTQESNPGLPRCRQILYQLNHKGSPFHSNPKERQCQRMVKLPHYDTIAVISHTSKVMLKILQARLQQYVNHELQMFRLDLEKAEEPEIKLPTSIGSSKKQESSTKPSTSALLTMPKPLTVWITINCGKFWKSWEYETTWPASWETCRQVRKQKNWTWNNRLVLNRERSTSRLYIVTLLI